VQEEDEQGRKRIGRNKSGTPQGGVLSPLLANIYLHWFDRIFHRKGGPAHWANATLIRYADDFVVMARYMSPQIQDFIEQKLEAWLGLKLNRQKSRIVNLRRNQERLEFLGYQIGLAPVRADRRRHYWRMEPSHKAMRREVDRIWEMTAPKYGWKPLPESSHLEIVIRPGRSAVGFLACLSVTCTDIRHSSTLMRNAKCYWSSGTLWASRRERF